MTNLTDHGHIPHDNDTLDQVTRDILKDLFSSQIVMKAYEHIRHGDVSISFRKGSIDRYFIVSGIVSDDTTAEAKITYKKRDDGIVVTSQCDCLSWNENDHCRHSAALFVKFFLQDRELAHLPKLNRRQTSFDEGVTVAEYGTIVPSAQKFSGQKTRAGSTYFALKYRLTSGQVNEFPIPVKLEHKIRIHLYPTIQLLNRNQSFDSSELEIPADLYTPRFAIEDEDGNETKEISLFEHVYLFDWNSGISYHIPDDFIELLNKLKQFPLGLKINDYLRISQKLRDNNDVDILIDDTNIDSVASSECKAQISIKNSDKKNFLDVSVQFPNADNQLSPIWDELRIFSFGNGLLDTFKKKSEAYKFLENLVESFATDQNATKKYTRQSTTREYVELLIDQFFEKEYFEAFDEKAEHRYVIKKETIKTIFSELLTHFDVQAFRFSSINDEFRSITLQVRKSKVLDSITDFYYRVHPLDVAIFFDDKKVQQWRSGLQFFRTKHDIDWFSLELEISEEDFQIIKQADLDATHVMTSQGLVLLNNDQRSLLKFLKKYTKYEKQGETTENEGKGKRKRRFQLPFSRSRIFELFELKKLGLDGALTDEEVEFCHKLMSLEELPEYPLPDNFNAKLRPYQKEGYNWLRFLHENKFGACLADDMGLGKTIQTISFIESIQHELNRVIIICPVSILMNWENEFQKFSSISEDLCLYYGGTRELDLSKKIIITSYGVMKKEATTTFKDINFDLIVMDEVQNLKNIRSMGATAARQLKGRFRICLTGTPVENDLSEFYNILDLSIPGIWGNLDYIKSQSAKKTRLMAKRTARPFILRRTKAQVLKDLPPKVENTVYLRFSEKEKESYLYTLSKIRKRIETILSKQRYGEVLKGLLELRQQCLWQEHEQMISTKVKFLMKNLEQIMEEGHQVLIFSQFTTYLNIIQNKLVEQGIKYSRIDGSYSLKKREENVRTFQNGDNKVFLISLKAGGLGLNLTAANYIFLMDPWWNPAVESQAVDRAHRIGQKKSLNVYRLIMKDSIEEKVLKLQEIKRELFEDLLSNQGDEYFTGKLSMKDFEALLSEG